MMRWNRSKAFFCRRDRALGGTLLIAIVLLGTAIGCEPEGSSAGGLDEASPREQFDNVQGTEGAERLKATADLARLVEDWVGMWNSYDLNQVQELFLSDPRLTYFSSEKEGVIRGMEALLEHHAGFGFIPGGEERVSRLWLESTVTDLLSGAAVITGIWFFRSDGNMDNTPQRGPVTMVAVREGEEWRFVHMNFSEYLPDEEH